MCTPNIDVASSVAMPTSLELYNMYKIHMFIHTSLMDWAMSLHIAKSVKNKFLGWPNPPFSIYTIYIIRWNSSVLSVDSSKSKENNVCFLHPQLVLIKYVEK